MVTRKITEQQLEKFNEGLNHATSVEELIGRDGLITELFKDTLQSMMEAELTHHLGYQKGKGSRTSKYQQRISNKRNGHTTRTLRSSMGEMELLQPRDREGSFEAQILEKNTSSVTN